MPTEPVSNPAVEESKVRNPGLQHVLIIKSNLEAYRAPFFSGLEKRLAQEHVQLRVAVPVNRCAAFEGDWLLPVAGGDIHFLSKTLSWQGVSEHLGSAQMIIVQQSARELTNYWLICLQKKYGYKLALWGHGTEFQRSFTTQLASLAKRIAFRKVDFWFAYTPGVAKIVEKQGYPHGRICAVGNSVDTASEVAFHQSIDEGQKRALRAKLGMQERAKLVSYCGSLYKAKRLDFLVDACKRIRGMGIDLHLAVIGDGEMRPILASLAQEYKWLHVAGPLYGERKALFLYTSECMVVPGVIGLVVVDAFAHECPLVTTSTTGHGPEIEYLEDGVNGVIADDSIDDYIRSLVRVLTEDQLRLRLKQGCREAASRITIENMIDNFATGVLKALRMPKIGELGKS